MRKTTVILSAAATSVALVSLSSQAQSNKRDFSTYTPSVSPQRIAISDAPKIDGMLDDPVWEMATLISELYQVDLSSSWEIHSASKCHLFFDLAELKRHDGAKVRVNT